METGRVNRLIQGDCLALMRALPARSVDLIYADPPFFSGRPYSVGRKVVFDDRWEAGLSGYLTWMRDRLAEMKRILRPTGSLLVHADWHAVHYLKVELDRMFGIERFQNELIWHYRTGGASKVRFSRKHDTILWYTRSSRTWTYEWTRIRIGRTEKSLARARNPKGARISRTDTEKNPEDVLHIPSLNPMARERTGYPTQKPEALLRMLVAGLSQPGDIVGDFFCGSGTTPVVAQKLGRRWIACDSSSFAMEATVRRLEDVGACYRREIFPPADSLAVRAGRRV